MQLFTRWTNLSEATFVLPPSEPGADYRVRIFTSASATAARGGMASELPFAGHPTLGTCHAWLEASGTPRQAEVVVQECGAGLGPVRRTADGPAFAAPPLIRSGPVEEALVEHVASALRIDRAEVVDAAWADTGRAGWPFCLRAPTPSLRPSPASSISTWGSSGPYPEGSPQAFEVRAFFPKHGATAEDPVTGSLNASLVQWLLGSGRATSPYVASQGTVLGRAGRVHVSREADDDDLGRRQHGHLCQRTGRALVMQQDRADAPPLTVPARRRGRLGRVAGQDGRRRLRAAGDADRGACAAPVLRRSRRRRRARDERPPRGLPAAGGAAADAEHLRRRQP
jgi:predicted PhzF superfamily epimerase YddE/YHI9